MRVAGGIGANTIIVYDSRMRISYKIMAGGGDDSPSCTNSTVVLIV